MKKVVLVLVDGMRPDAISRCGHSFLARFASEGLTCMEAKTVLPSITLPCHSSLFFSVDPTRHGITSNTWRPMARPIDSLVDAIAKAGKRAAMFYNWEELRDLNRPGSLVQSYYQAEDLPLEEGMASEQELTARCIEYLQANQPDFLFLYLGYTDVAGHNHGWMKPEYLQALGNASGCIERLQEALPTAYQLVITADHGGHERDHGLDLPEDCTIPLIFHGTAFPKGQVLQHASIKDIAPTIAAILDIPVPREWEGKNLCVK